MQVSDVDFATGFVVIREKKRAHDRRTTRRVPLSTGLAVILKDWLTIHPGGPYLFAQAEEVFRSKKRTLRLVINGTTGREYSRPGLPEYGSGNDRASCRSPRMRRAIT